MRTPTGKECPYFYGDYYRGRSKEECRLVGSEWKRNLCNNCPVPEISLANSCENMILNPMVHRPFFILKTIVRITAYCKKNGKQIKEPKIGCGECHQLPGIFLGDQIEPDSTS